MTAIRRSALTLALTMTAVLGSAGATATASFADSASRTTSLTTAAIVAPGNLKGSLVCGKTSSTMGATWTASPSARISAYVVTVYFSDGFVQVVELGPTDTSWSAPIQTYYVTASSIQYTVTARTDYGWSTESAPTGTFAC